VRRIVGWAVDAGASRIGRATRIQVVIAASGGDRAKWTAGLLVLPATAIVLGLVVVPLGIMLRYSLNRFDPSSMMVEAFTLENYVRFFSDAFYRQVMLTTVGVATVATFVCLVLGFPAASTCSGPDRPVR
jgi:putative spermidine/putrescine transport system permease protein